MAWVRVAGKARNYVNSDTGEILSRRQYDKRFAGGQEAKPRATGPRPARARENAAKASAGFARLARIEAEKSGRKPRDVRSDPAFGEQWRDFSKLPSRKAKGKFLLERGFITEERYRTAYLNAAQRRRRGEFRIRPEPERRHRKAAGRARPYSKRSKGK